MTCASPVRPHPFRIGSKAGRSKGHELPPKKISRQEKIKVTSESKVIAQIILIIIGALMIIIGIGADWLGLGPVPGIGLKQIAMIIVGAGCIVAGFIMRSRSKS